jgi:hypothetical protein
MKHGIKATVVFPHVIVLTVRVDSQFEFDPHKFAPRLNPDQVVSIGALYRRLL